MPPIHKRNRRLRIPVEPHLRGRGWSSTTTGSTAPTRGCVRTCIGKVCGFSPDRRPAQAAGGGQRGTAGCRSRGYTHADGRCGPWRRDVGYWHVRRWRPCCSSSCWRETWAGGRDAGAPNTAGANATDVEHPADEDDGTAATCGRERQVAQTRPRYRSLGRLFLLSPRVVRRSAGLYYLHSG